MRRLMRKSMRRAMRRFFFVIFLVSFAVEQEAAFAYNYNIDQKQISLSGLSSGSYMAGQVHVALSEVFMGLGLISGGPYYCAQGDLNRAQTECMAAPQGPPKIAPLVRQAQKLAYSGEIDSVKNLSKTRLFLFSGKNDTVVVPTVVQTGINFYKNLGVPSHNVKFIDRVPAGHGYPTLNYGNPCETHRTSPFINNCNYDAAGALLNHIYPNLKEKVVVKNENFFEFSQRQYAETDVSAISMNETGIAYVPTNCQNGDLCRLHLAFHGCKQTLDHIGDKFYKYAGYNGWAEANNIIVIYPQAVSNHKLTNPNGCWDWYGYTGKKYHTKRGPQIEAIHKIIINFSKLH